MRTHPLVLAGALLIVTACSDLQPPGGYYDVGFVSAAAIDDGLGGYTMSPEAAFYRRSTLRFQPLETGDCSIAVYSESTVLPIGLQTMNAGPQLTAQVSGQVESLEPMVDFGFLRYRHELTAGFAFTPGDTLRISVPGATNGFPEAVVAVRTAEAFTHDEIGIPASGQPLSVSWTAAPAPGSTMAISLRYAVGVQSILNQQVYCVFPDTGAAVIPGTFLAGWVNSTGDVRETRLIRTRFREIELPGRRRLTAISTFGQPLDAGAVVPPAVMATPSIR